MASKQITYLICYDDHRNFTDDIKKRFSDSSRYMVSSFHTQNDFIGHFRAETERKACKVAIIGVPESVDQFESVEKLRAEVKKTDPDTRIILLTQADKLEELKKNIRFNIDAYVPRTGNAILRIHNAVKKIISEYNITIYRKRRNLSLSILFIFIAIALLFLTFSYFRIPQYF